MTRRWPTQRRVSLRDPELPGPGTYTIRTTWASLGGPLSPRPESNRDGNLFSIVIADVSGEYFGPFRGGGPLGPIETYFRRADHVVHLLDAALLHERRDRARALAASQSLLRRFGESGLFGPRTKHTPPHQ